MQITLFEHARPAWLAKTKLRAAKEIAMLSGIFVEGGRQTLLYSCKRQEQESTEKSSNRTSRL